MRLLTLDEICQALSLSPRSIRRRVASGLLTKVAGPQGALYELAEPEPPPPTEEPIDELLARREQAFRREAARSERRVTTVPIDGPILICHLGDPHVDDDGCDLPLLRKELALLRDEPHAFPGNVGDSTNNWVGRLQSLYAHQSSTASEAVRLLEWLVGAADRWAYWVLGNHDLWNGGEFLHSLLRKHGSTCDVFEPYEAAVEYRTPSDKVVRMVVRHDFKGHSMWNKQHALQRRAKTRPWGDLYVAGHRHVWGSSTEEAADGRAVTTLRVRGYKRFDSYGAALDLPEDNLGASLSTVIDPDAPEGERVRVFHDLEMGLDYLHWLRSRRGLN